MSSVEVGLIYRCGTIVIGDECTIEYSVTIAVVVVACTVEVVGLCPVVEVLVRTFGTSDEVVVDDILIVVGCGVSADDTHAVVIYHIIIILHVALHLRVAALVVCPKTMVDGPVASAVGDGAETLRLYAFGDDAMLPSDVIGIGDVDVVPRSP